MIMHVTVLITEIVFSYPKYLNKKRKKDYTNLTQQYWLNQ